ncbi:FaeA/PapI family transcriptional regulator [Streptomyces sp. NPDC020883]|uniref:FaeA/PapI family transcriptional regulator n=1 Tax=Streptomyces sp. NPDC020883 TaxID=3365099 RepID=UPI0037A429B6
MSSRTVDIAPALAGGISDRAFRLYCYFLHYSRGGWVTVQEAANACSLTNHQAREPLSELRAEGMVESRRVYEMGAHGRKTWHTHFRLLPETATEAAA